MCVKTGTKGRTQAKGVRQQGVEEGTGAWDKGRNNAVDEWPNGNLLICTTEQKLLVEGSEKWKMQGRGQRKVRLSKELHTEFWWENLRETDHLEDLDVDERVF